MAIGEANHFPDVEPLAVGDHRELVGEGNVDVAEGVFDQLGHFGRADVGGDAFALYEALVESQRLARATRGDPADRTVVVCQFLEDLAGQHALGAIGYRNIGSAFAQARQREVAALGCNQVAQRLGGADRAGRFENHRVALLEHASNLRRRRHHIAGVRRVPAILGEGGRHRDHEDICRRYLRRGLEQPALHRRLDQTVEIDFLDMDLAAVDRVDDALRDIQPVDRTARAGNDRRGGQADIAETDDADVGLDVTAHELGFPEVFAPALASVGKFYSNVPIKPRRSPGEQIADPPG